MILPQRPCNQRGVLAFAPAWDIPAIKRPDFEIRLSSQMGLGANFESGTLTFIELVV